LHQQVCRWQQVFLTACHRRREHPAATEAIARGLFSAIAKHQGHKRESENSACVVLIAKKEKPASRIWLMLSTLVAAEGRGRKDKLPFWLWFPSGLRSPPFLTKSNM
jgi:hypothetical protein